MHTNHDGVVPAFVHPGLARVDSVYIDSEHEEEHRVEQQGGQHLTYVGLL